MSTTDKQCLERARELKFNAQFCQSGKKKAIVLFTELFLNQFSYKIEQREKDFEIILANLIYDKTPVLLPMNKNYWTGQLIKYQTINIIKHILESEGYIDSKKGFYDHNDRSRSRFTRIWATPKLNNLFENETIYSTDNFDLVELKTRKQRDKHGIIKKDKAGNGLLLKKSRKISFKKTGKTMKLRRELRKINRVNGKAKITLNGTFLNVSLKAVYTESFKYHGRLYATGINQFQQFSKEERSKILIDGEPVIELDYSGLHPRLLYAREKIQFNEDPYTIVNGDPVVRPFQKVMLLAMINSNSFNKAEAACNSWLYPEYEQDRDGNYKKDLPMTKLQKVKFKKHCKKAAMVKKAGVEKARPLMEAFFKVHKPIQKYLCTGDKTGLELMNKDSKIALDVCKYFSKKNISILPIHDSFIVQAKYKNELTEVMDKMFKKHSNGFSCPIN